MSVDVADTVAGTVAEAELVEDLGTDHVVVRMGGGRYGLCAPDVAEVVAVPTVTRLPGVPSWIVGIANWRGRVLPLVDLRPLIGLAITPLPSSARVVVLAVDDVEVGVLVEAVAGLVPVVEPLPPLPATVRHTDTDLLRGLAEGDSGGPLVVVDTGAVLGLRSRLPGRSRTA